MSGPGCGGYTAKSTAASATAMSMALQLLATLNINTAAAVTVFARSFILGNERQIIIQL